MRVCACVCRCVLCVALGTLARPLARPSARLQQRAPYQPLEARRQPSCAPLGAAWGACRVTCTEITSSVPLRCASLVAAPSQRAGSPAPLGSSTQPASGGEAGCACCACHRRWVRCLPATCRLRAEPSRALTLPIACPAPAPALAPCRSTPRSLRHTASGAARPRPPRTWALGPRRPPMRSSWPSPTHFMTATWERAPATRRRCCTAWA